MKRLRSTSPVALLALAGLSVALPALASPRLTPKCVSVSKTTCKVVIRVTASDNNALVSIKLPAPLAGAVFNVNKQGTGVAYGNPHELAGGKTYVMTLIVPTTVPAGTEALITLKLK